MRNVAISLLVVFLSTAAADAQEAAPPAKPWATSFGAGLSMTSGNTDTKNFNLSFSTKYDPKTKFVFKSDALYLRGDSNGEKQVDKASANARGEYSVSDRTFAFGEVTYLRDPFKDLNYFIAPMAGAGYRIINSAAESLTVDGAVGGQVQSGTPGRTSSAVLKAGQNFDLALSPTSKITQKLTGIWKTKDFGDSLYHFDAGLTTVLATRLDLKFAYVFDYQSRPTIAGVKKGDSSLVAALLLKF